MTLPNWRPLATEVALFVLATTLPLAHADTYPRQPGVDVVQYRFHLILSDDTDAIEGETSVEFSVVQDGVATLALDLVQPKPAAPDRGMTVSAVTEAARRAYEHTGDRLAIRVRIQTERGHKVVDTGPYAIVRHPMYLSAVILFSGTALALGSFWSALIPAAIVALVLVVRTALEDRTLQNELDGYKAYAGRVRYRLLPGVW